MDTETKRDRIYSYLVLGIVVAAIIIGFATGHSDLVIDILKGAGLMMLAITILVTIHELGHFWAAKAFGMRVETFSIGFPPVVWKTKRGETEYQIGLIPLGGFVKISGIIDESLDDSNMQSEPQPWEFRAKPVWQRLIVMVGGVTMNVILGVLVFTAMKFFFGENRTPVSEFKNRIEVQEVIRIKDKVGEHCRIPLGYYLGLRTGDSIISFSGKKFPYVEDYQTPQLLVDGGYFEVKRGDKIEKLTIPKGAMNLMSADTIAPVMFDLHYDSRIKVVEDKEHPRPAQKAGVKTNDIITKIDSIPVRYFSDIVKILDKNYKPNQSITLGIDRDGKPMDIVLQLDSATKMGVGPILKDDIISYGLGEAFSKGSSEAFGFISANAKGFGKMASGEVKASKSVMGPLGIAKKYLEIFTKGGWKGFLFLTGMLSMILAFMNILPIPALDGGHVVFLLIEAVMGKEPPLKVRLIVQQIGMVLLLLLMVLIIGNDFITHIFGDGPKDLCK